MHNGCVLIDDKSSASRLCNWKVAQRVKCKTNFRQLNFSIYNWLSAVESDNKWKMETSSPIKCFLSSWVTTNYAKLVDEIRRRLSLGERFSGWKILINITKKRVCCGKFTYCFGFLFVGLLWKLHHNKILSVKDINTWCDYLIRTMQTTYEI